MDINAVSAVSREVEIVDRGNTGFNALTAESFIKLLIVTLQNQDPTEPVGNDELLSQLSAMRSLQSNSELSEALKSITKNQQLSTAAGFIGRTVTGSVGDQSINGVVDRAFLRGGFAFVGVGGSELPLSNIITVELTQP